MGKRTMAVLGEVPYEIKLVPWGELGSTHGKCDDPEVLCEMAIPALTVCRQHEPETLNTLVHEAIHGAELTLGMGAILSEGMVSRIADSVTNAILEVFYLEFKDDNWSD